MTNDEDPDIYAILDTTEELFAIERATEKLRTLLALNDIPGKDHYMILDDLLHTRRKATLQNIADLDERLWKEMADRVEADLNPSLN